MMKHTPGPWSLETVKTSCGVCHKIGTFSACVYDDHTTLNPFNHAELLANARLIAAAPELLEALKECAFRLATLVAATAEYSDVHARAIDWAHDVISKVESAT